MEAEDRYTVPALIEAVAFREKLGPLDGCIVEMGHKAFMEAVEDLTWTMRFPPTHACGMPFEVLDSGVDDWRVQVVG